MTGLYGVEVGRVEVSTTVRNVADRIGAWAGEIAVGGGRYSMGGQVAVTGGLHLDMRSLNRLVWIRPEDGAVVEASAVENSDLFRAAIGGYGAVGVITEVELALAENVRIERVVAAVALDADPGHFVDNVLRNADNVPHNADLLPPDFDTAVSVTRRKTAKPLTEPARLIPRGQRRGWAQNAIWVMTELPGSTRRAASSGRSTRPAGSQTRCGRSNSRRDAGQYA